MHEQPSIAFRRFIRGWFYDWHLIMLINQAIPRTAFEAYAEQSMHPRASHPDAVRDEAENIRQNLYRIVWTRLVDHFQTYLTNALFAILDRRPDLLAVASRAGGLKKPAKTVAEAARKIRGFERLQTVFAAIGVPLATSEEQRRIIAHGIKFRNLVVHAEGVDEEGEFIDTPDDAAGVDLIPGIVFDQLAGLEAAVRVVAEQTDALAIATFGIDSTQ